MGSTTRKERDNIRLMLTDTIRLLIKNGLTFRQKFNVEGLLGVTVDDGEVFLISLNELVRSDSNTVTPLELNIESDNDESKSVVMRLGQSARKRLKTSLKDPQRLTLTVSSSHISQSVDATKDVLAVVANDDIIDDITMSLPKVVNELAGEIKIKEEIDAEAWLEENDDYPRTVYPDGYDQGSQHSSFSDSLYASTSFTPKLTERTSAFMMHSPHSSGRIRSPAAMYAKYYRYKKRDDLEFRRKNAERSRKYRLNLSEEKKARNRDMARVRQQRYLMRIKDKQDAYRMEYLMPGNYGDDDDDIEEDDDDVDDDVNSEVGVGSGSNEVEEGKDEMAGSSVTKATTSEQSEPSVNNASCKEVDGVDVNESYTMTIDQGNGDTLDVISVKIEPTD